MNNFLMKSFIYPPYYLRNNAQRLWRITQYNKKEKKLTKRWIGEISEDDNLKCVFPPILTGRLLNATSSNNFFHAPRLIEYIPLSKWEPC